MKLRVEIRRETSLKDETISGVFEHIEKTHSLHSLLAEKLVTNVEKAKVSYLAQGKQNLSK